MEAQYISEIIHLLSDDTQSMVGAFLKAQIFAKRIGNEVLYKWVVQELNGYEAGSELPSYRYAKCTNFAVLKQRGRLLPEQSLPFTSFSKVVSEMLLKYRVFSSIKALEEIISTDPKGAVIHPHSADFCQLLTDDLRQQGRTFGVHSLRTNIQVFEFTEVLMNIRSKLLELVLELEEDFPNIDMDLESRVVDKQAVNQTINYIMNKIKITTTGDGNTINTGDNSTVTNNAVITTGNKEELKKFLNEKGVSNEDYTLLAEVIDEEASLATTERFGAKVNSWVQYMVGKALSGTWDIGVGTAGAVLAEGILRYYGLK